MGATPDPSLVHLPVTIRAKASTPNMMVAPKEVKSRFVRAASSPIYLNHHQFVPPGAADPWRNPALPLRQSQATPPRATPSPARICAHAFGQSLSKLTPNAADRSPIQRQRIEVAAKDVTCLKFHISLLAAVPAAGVNNTREIGYAGIMAFRRRHLSTERTGPLARPPHQLVRIPITRAVAAEINAMTEVVGVAVVSFSAHFQSPT